MPDITSSYTDAELAAIDKTRGTKTRTAFQRDAANFLVYLAGNTPPPVPVPPADLAGTWRLAWSDEFDTGLTKWNVQNNSTFGQSGNNEIQTYMAANVTISNGELVLAARDAAGKVTSGMVTTRKQGGDVKYKATGGYWEAEVACTIHSALWPGWWLVGPSDGTTPGWPAYGEYDWELYGANPSYAESNFHWADATGAHKHVGANRHFLNGGGQDTFHRYGFAILPDRLRWYLDGVRVREYVLTTVEQKRTVTYPHCPILNLAVGGDGPKAHGWDGKYPTGLDARMRVRSVRHWQPA